MRWIKRGLIVVAAALLVSVGLIFAYAAVMESIGLNRARAFYDNHNLLAVIRDATKGVDPWKSDLRAIKRSVFLESIPLGTTEPETIRALASEGFFCRRWNSRRSKHALDCYLNYQPDYIQRWSIQIDFDDEEKLADANVIVLKSPTFSY